jgi:hypothetical protein
MRAPASSFKSVVVSYRDAVLDGAPAGSERDFVSDVLKRWLSHPDTERIWEAIREASIANENTPPLASLFIAWILRIGLDYQLLSKRIEKAPAVQSELRSRAERDWRAGSDWDAAFKRAFAKEGAQFATDVLGRQKGGAPEKRFRRMVRDTFIENCGRPLNDTVAVLAEITFGTEVSSDAVRGTNRSTTRSGRRTKGRDRDTRPRK